MSEFKVGDRVRVKDVEFEGIVDEVLRMEIPNYVGSLQGGTFYNSYRVISEDKYYTGLEENMLELIERPKAINPEILQELEQRIEKLEKEVFKPVEIKETKPSLLTEDERVILRNLDKKYKYITRDSIGYLFVHSSKPKKEYEVWCCFDGGYESFIVFSHLFKFIQWTDKEPYNIEELLKGESGNE